MVMRKCTGFYDIACPCPLSKESRALGAPPCIGTQAECDIWREKWKKEFGDTDYKGYLEIMREKELEMQSNSKVSIQKSLDKLSG